MRPTLPRGIHINGLVRARHDIPQVGVRVGERGVVQSRWFEPHTAFEVEFRRGKLELPLRVILDASDIEPADDQSDRTDDAELGGGE